MIMIIADGASQRRGGGPSASGSAECVSDFAPEREGLLFGTLLRARFRVQRPRSSASLSSSSGLGFGMYRVASRRVASRRIASHRIASHRTISCRTSA